MIARPRSLRDRLVPPALVLAAMIAAGTVAAPARAAGIIAVPARAGEPVARAVSVQGMADVTVVPDRAELVLGIETKAESLATATRDNDARVRRIIAFLRQSGIPADRIQTDHISIQPVYDEHDTQRLDYFQVQKSIAASVSDLPGFDALLAGALERGATHVLDVTFRTTRLRAHRDEARARATQAAREKAAALATAMGARLGPVQSVRENLWGGWYGYAGGAWNRWNRGGGQYAQNVLVDGGGGAGTSEDGTIAPGRIKVSATIDATFALE